MDAKYLGIAHKLWVFYTNLISRYLHKHHHTKIMGQMAMYFWFCEVAFPGMVLAKSPIETSLVM